MKRHLVSVFLMALLLCSVGRTSLASPRGEAKSKSDFRSTESSSSTEHRPGVILVKFRPDVPTTDAADSLGARDLAVLGEVADLQVHRVAVPEGQEEDVVEMLTQDPRVEYAEVDYAVHATIIHTHILTLAFTSGIGVLSRGRNVSAPEIHLSSSLVAVIPGTNAPSVGSII